MIFIYLLQVFIMLGLIIFIYIYSRPAPKAEDFVENFFYQLALADYEYDQKHAIQGIEFLLILFVILIIGSEVI